MTAIRNIVFIVSDTFRTDHLGCYGNTWIRAPNLDRLAAESILFEDAYAEGLFTKPVRRVMFTGRRTLPFADWRPVKGDDIQAPGWQPLGEDVIALAEWLGE